LKQPNPNQPCPDCGCQLHIHSDSDEAGIPFCDKCCRECKVKGTRFARAFARWQYHEMDLVEITLDATEMCMILDALDLWEEHGCPIRSTMLIADPPVQKQIEDLKCRLWDADEIIIRIQHGVSEIYRKQGAH